MKRKSYEVKGRNSKFVPFSYLSDGMICSFSAFQISDKIRLEAELERQEEQLRELQRRYSATSGPQVRPKVRSVMYLS